ncbi:MAG: hypothetical protein R2719_08720 [Micropruina sp.]
MQRLFPEGAFFTHVLTGLAAASTGDAATVAAALDDSGTDAVKAVFGDIPALDGGTFYRGWRLVLFAEHVRLGGADRGALAAEADAVQRALAASATGVPPSYPNGYWPCDAVVAMAGVLRARQVAGQRPDEAMLAEWRSRIGTVRDPASGLLAHRISATGTVVEGRAAVPRRSSRRSGRTWIRGARPANGPGSSTASWCARRAWWASGSIRGATTPGDVDSGPLVFGVSASASAVTLGAARRNGATTLADDLDREAEYLGLPLEWAGTRRFAFGLLPVGDAFVAWAGSPGVHHPGDRRDPSSLLVGARPGAAAAGTGRRHLAGRLAKKAPRLNTGDGSYSRSGDGSYSGSGNRPHSGSGDGSVNGSRNRPRPFKRPRGGRVTDRITRNPSAAPSSGSAAEAEVEERLAERPDGDQPDHRDQPPSGRAATLDRPGEAGGDQPDARDGRDHADGEPAPLGFRHRLPPELG